MKKKILLALLATACLAGGTAAMAGCDTNGAGSGHHFSAGWTYNADNLDIGHWHKCEDEDCKEISGLTTHKWDDGAVTKQASCSEEGVKTFTCTDCHATKTEPIQKVAHTWSDWAVATEDIPTAEKEGKAKRNCTIKGCDETDSHEEHTLPKLDSADYALTNNTATCEEAGTATYTYNKDGVSVSFTAASPVNPDNHSYDTTKWASNGAQHWHEASCEHKVVDNAANVVDLADHTIGADGYCTVCYTTSLTPLKNSFAFVAGNGIKFTAYIYGMSGDVNTFTYNGTATVQVEYGGYDDQGIYHSDKVTLSSGGTTKFDFTLANSQSVIYITSDSAEQVGGTLTRPAELGENENGYPVTPSGEGEPYEFEGVDTPAGNKFQYVMTADNANAEIYIDGENGREKVTLPYKFRLADGVKKVFYMSYADGSSVSGYNVAIDREWDEGTVIRPTEVETGVDKSVTVAAGDEYYCSFLPAENGWYKISSATANAVLIAGSKAEVGSGQIAVEEKYGESGNGFIYYANIKDSSIYNQNTQFKFRLASLNGEELACNFKIEKVADATALELGAAKTGNTVYMFTAADTGTDYMLAVSDLPECGYWTVVYESEGLKIVQSVTALKTIISPTVNSDFTVIYESTAGSVTLSEDDSALHLSMGASAKLTAFTEYAFVVPVDGDYTITLTTLPGGSFWFLNGNMVQNKSEKLTGLAIDDIVTIKVQSATVVTILSEDNKKISAATNDVTVNAGSKKLLYLTNTNTPNVDYTLTIFGNDVQFVGGGTSKKVTANAGGGIWALVEYVGEGESATVQVGVEQAPIEIQLDTEYGTSGTGSPKRLYANVVYSFTATEAGNYVISGLKLSYDAEETYCDYVVINGVKHLVTEDTTEYTIEGVEAGATVSFSLSYVYTTKGNVTKVSLATATA